MPLEVTLSRPIYYVTQIELNYPTVHSFTDFIKDRSQPDKPITVQNDLRGFLSLFTSYNKQEENLSLIIMIKNFVQTHFTKYYKDTFILAIAG